MKRIIFTMVAITVIAVGSVNFTYAATAKSNASTTLSHIGNISKIEVRGNVEVYVSNGSKDEVTVNNNYYNENALIQEENGVLRISSYKKEKLVVYVTASDLHSIAAYNNAVVKSDGRLAIINLDVNLYDHAYAGLKLDSYAANINVNDEAKADLTGSIVEYNLNYSHSATVNRSQLVAMNAAETVVAPQTVDKQNIAKGDLVKL